MNSFARASEDNKLQLFQEKAVRTHWDDEQGKWYFSVQDIVQILSDSKDVKQYIKRMRSRNSLLNLNWGTICTPVEMRAGDGKIRKIQAADTEGVLRIIQSIPSKNAEPFKLWLAKVGAERIDEVDDPELAFDRAMKTYLAKGYSKEWMNNASRGKFLRHLFIVGLERLSLRNLPAGLGWKASCLSRSSPTVSAAASCGV